MTSHNETTLRGRTIISTTHQRIMKIFSKQVTSAISDPLTFHDVRKSKHGSCY